MALVNRFSSPGRLHYIPQFLCISWFCLRNSIFEVTPQVFYWIKVWRLGWPLHNVNRVGLEPRCCSLCVFGIVVLLKHPFQGHFFFSIRQHKLFKYFNVLKLIHDPWNAINRPTTWYEKPPHIMMLAPPCFTVFVFGGRLTNCLDPKITILLYQSTKYCTISL